jgi:hypothetical protein
MYSNIITPPDFATDDFHTVTVINATEDDIKLLVTFCENSEKSYNIYLYKDDMDLTEWVEKSIAKSQAIILSSVTDKWQHLMCRHDVYYYSDQQHICPAIHAFGILDYFVANEQK